MVELPCVGACHEMTTRGPQPDGILEPRDSGGEVGTLYPELQSKILKPRVTTIHMYICTRTLLIPQDNMRV
jgi:hypothetical protein